MAEHLARIIGTEEDRVNCPFYWKIGACRHGDQCSRSHYKPTSSQTLVLRHMYQNPPVALAIAEGQDVDNELADKAQDHFELFYIEVFEELANYGQIEEMVVCDNIGDHMIGNVYAKYASEDDAEKAAAQLKGRYYGGRMIELEFSPVTDFREARCRQFVDGQCTRGGYCNFMHMKHVPRSLKRKMIKQMFEDHPEYRKTAAMFTDDPSRGGRRHDNRGRNDHYNQGRDRYDSSRGERGHPVPGSGSSRDDRGGGYRDYNRDGGHRSHDYRGGDRPPRRDHYDGGYGGRGGDRDGHDRFRHGRYGGHKTPSSPSRGSGAGTGGGGRQSSQERRAMIAEWNREADDNAAAAISTSHVENHNDVGSGAPPMYTPTASLQPINGGYPQQTAPPSAPGPPTGGPAPIQHHPHLPPSSGDSYYTGGANQ